MPHHTDTRVLNRYLLWPNSLPYVHELLIVLLEFRREEIHRTVTLSHLQDQMVPQENGQMMPDGLVVHFQRLGELICIERFLFECENDPCTVRASAVPRKNFWHIVVEIP